MWIQKTKNEIRKDTAKSSLLWALYIFVIAIILGAISSKLGYRKYESDVQPLTWNELSEISPFIVTFSFCAAIFIFLLRYFGKGKLNFIFSTYICPNCGALWKSGNKMKCKCGGKFQNIDELKWIEES